MAETQNQTPVVEEAAPVMLKLFRSRTPSVSYVCGSLMNPDGKPKYPDMNGHKVIFIDNRFATNDPRIIEELEDQIKKGFTEIYVDPREPEVDSRYMDPMFRLKDTLRKQIFKELGLDPTKDMGNYAQGKLNVGTSTTIAPVAAGGDGTGMQGKLAQVASLLNG